MIVFSIIIPVFNKQQFIYKTIQSVLNQTIADFEILIINDGSTDNSEFEILKFNDFRIRYFNQKNNGVSKARNMGIRNAKGQYICFLDADDLWNSDFLETFRKYIALVPNQKVFSSQFEVETSKKIFLPTYSIKKTNDFEVVNFFKASFKESVLWTSCAVFEKSVFDKVGVFDEQIKKGEDTDLWIRIGLNYEIVFIWKVLAKYGFDESSISRNFHYWLEELTFEKYKVAEKKNADLKKYLDLNRYSVAIKCKIIGNKNEFKKYKNEILYKNLTLKKQFLLLLPSYLLKKLIKIKTLLANLGLSNSVFK